MPKLDTRDLDLAHLDELESDEFFENHEKIEKAPKFVEDSKDNLGHKKPSPRKPKIR